MSIDEEWEDYVEARVAEEGPHVGHCPLLGSGWFCDTCNSPYCELA